MINTSVGLALSDRIRQTSKNLNLNPEWAADRHVGERIVNAWHIGMGPAPVMVVGGLLYPQALRPTQDLDLKAIRRYSNDELQRGIAIISDHLERHEGISVVNLSPEAHEMHVGESEPVLRYKLEARIGGPRGMRATPRIDIALATGPHSLPKNIKKMQFPSFMSKGAPFICLAQPLEAACGDHWMAVLNQRPDDLRMKHFADILLCMSAGLDAGKVADEIERICRHRGISCDLPVEPDAIAWSEFERREADWDRLMSQRPGLPGLTNAFLDIADRWAYVSAHLQINAESRARLQVKAPSIAPDLHEDRGRILEFPRR